MAIEKKKVKLKRVADTVTQIRKDIIVERMGKKIWCLLKRGRE